jgi:hypothetical protein
MKSLGGFMKTYLHSVARTSGLLSLLVCLFCTQSSSAQSGWYSVEKVSLEFHELIRVELQGMVAESADPTLKSMALPYKQTLHYYGSLSRPERRYFPSVAEIRAWVTTEICKETHEQTLKPMRENGSIGSIPIKSKTKPSSVSVTGTRIETKGAPLSETVFCPAPTP